GTADEQLTGPSGRHVAQVLFDDAHAAEEGRPAGGRSVLVDLFAADDEGKRRSLGEPLSRLQRHAPPPQAMDELDGNWPATRDANAKRRQVGALERGRVTKRIERRDAVEENIDLVADNLRERRFGVATVVEDALASLEKEGEQEA